MNLNQYLASDSKHLEVFQSRRKVICFYGGAGSGKSYTVSDKILILCQRYKNFKAVVVRQTYPSLRRSCMDMIERRANQLGIKYHLNAQSATAKVGNSSQILFISLNHPKEYEKIKSMTDIDLVWMEEATEFPNEDAYEELKRRLRGGVAPFAQLILTFNPVGTSNWVHEHFFVKGVDNPHVVHVTVENNKWATKGYVEMLKRQMQYNENFYKIYYLGEWGTLEGVIFNNWDVVDAFPKDFRTTEVYGLDFGFSVSPFSLLQIRMRGDELWMNEITYHLGLTNEPSCRLMDEKGVPRDALIYADSAEPKSIEEFFRYGFSRIKPYPKGGDSVKTGIDWLLSKKIHLIDGSLNLKKEFSTACWQKDKNGNFLPVPMPINDHLIDCARYGAHGYWLEYYSGQPEVDAGEVNTDYDEVM